MLAGIKVGSDAETETITAACGVFRFVSLTHKLVGTPGGVSNDKVRYRQPWREAEDAPPPPLIHF